ncbi:MAG: CotH kinase family protein, partial [Verrucomicrobiales bacterium]
GNSSRTPNRMQKHSLRLTFSSSVGIPKLRYPLFPESDIEEFNKLVLRACFTDSWALNTWGESRYRPNDAQYFRDVWMKDSLAAMGQPSSYGNFVHLYVNGLYFGLHNLTERLEDDWYADHLGGEKEDWLINKDLSSPPSRWNTMMGVLNGNITDNAVYETAKDYIDVENYADYMLLHFYADSEDWPHHNGYAAANVNSGDGRFRFFVWDQEIALDKFSWNRYGTSSGGGAPFQRLRNNEEFRMLFADRVHKHMFNDGALSEQGSISRYLNLADEIDVAIVAESARWGDVQATTPYGQTPRSSTNIDNDNYPPTINNPIYFTREQHWVVERDNVTGHYIPTLHDESDSRSIIRELRAQSSPLYPSIDPPVFAQHGGPVPSDFNLAITTAAGDIYYTTDGSDPRMVGGGINPGATRINGGTIVDDFVGFEETGWLYLDTGVEQSDSEVVVGHPAYGVSDWKHPDFADAGWGTGQAMLGYGNIGSGASAITVNAEVEYGPSSTSKFRTTYFRKPFTVTGASEYTEVNVNIIRDDGAIIYLNGKEIGRSNLDAGNRSFSDFASSASPENAVIPLPSYTLQPGDLIEGINILAIEVHQSSAGSSDLGIDAEISASRPNGGGPGGATLSMTGPVLARALEEGEWSALTEASFIVGTPASSGNLVVSEIYYNPPGSLETTEFIELMNSSSTETIDLTGVTLTGVSYAFPEGFTLGPLGRVVIVKDQVAFAAAYNTAGLNIAPGDFGGTNLANGGEEIAVIGQDGATDIQRFIYDDQLPWPEIADGPGSSLVLIAPGTNPDHSLAANWRASSHPGGSPGVGDSMPFTGDPEADDDGDGLNAFLEHALGTSDSASSTDALPTAAIGSFDPGNGVEDEFLTLTFQRNLAADDVVFEVEVGSDLATWTTDTSFVSSTNNGDGTATEVHRSNTPMSSRERELIRLRVTSR